MNRLLSPLLVLLVFGLIAASPTAYAAGPPDQWVPAGLQGEYVTILVIDPLAPSTLYAATRAGLFKSNDAGANWFERDNGLNGLVSALAIDPIVTSTLYAGTNRGLWPAGPGLFKSYNGGENWDPDETSFTGQNISSLAIDHLMPSEIYIGVYLRFFGDIYKTLDTGVTWERIESNLSDAVNAIAIDPVSSATIYAGTSRLVLSESIGVLKSTDSGSNWFPMNSGLGGLSVAAICIDPLTPSTVYIVTHESGIYKSTDAGNNWSPINTGMEEFKGISLAIDPVMPATLYSGTLGGGVYRTSDGGNNWTAMNNGLGILDVTGIAIDPITPSIIYAGTSDGVYSIVVSGTPSDGDNSHNNSECFIRTASR